MNIALSGVTKKFGPTLALDNVSLDFNGRVNLILGTNGSGKSTFVNIVAGISYPQDETLEQGRSEEAL